MRDANLPAPLIREELEVVLEKIVPRIVTAAAIAQQQEPPPLGVELTPMSQPPAPQALDRELGVAKLS